MRCVAFIIVLILASCGGRDGGSPAPPGREFLTWRAPDAFTDNTPLDPARDLDRYEVYVSRDGNWDNEVPVAEVAAIDNAGRIAEEFEIGLLRAQGVNPTDNGSLVTMRAVSIHGKASGVGAPTFWEEK